MAPALNSYVPTSHKKRRVSGQGVASGRVRQEAKEKDLHERHLIKLSKDDQIRVAETLINPPKPTERFKRAAARYAEMTAA